MTAPVIPAPGIPPTEANTDRARSSSGRIEIVDVVRGVAVVLMAIDHVRVYSGVPPGGPDPGVFFTRWVTHFVAPIFALLAGTSAFLHGQRLRDRGALSRWLISRGLFLVIAELTIMRLAWTFNFAFDRTALAGVLWMLGWCMALLGVLIHLPLKALLAFGALVVAGHNLADLIPPDRVQAITGGSAGWLWRILYFGGPFKAGPVTVFVLFSIVPWIGVMSLGYCLGALLQWPEARRNQWLRTIGAAMIATFLVLRTIDVYGDRSKWRAQPERAVPAPAARAPSGQAPVGSARVPPPGARPTDSSATTPSSPGGSAGAPRQAPRRAAPWLRFIGTSKYPASLLFLLMTLGPALLLLGAPRLLPAAVARPLGVFGRTPMFYYLLHIPLIHLLALGVSLIRSGALEPWLFDNHPAMVPPPPEGYTWSLSLLYTVTAIAVLLLFGACRWYARYKAGKRHWWLSYL